MSIEIELKRSFLAGIVMATKHEPLLIYPVDTVRYGLNFESSLILDMVGHLSAHSTKDFLFTMGIECTLNKKGNRSRLLIKEPHLLSFWKLVYPYLEGEIKDRCDLMLELLSIKKELGHGVFNKRYYQVVKDLHPAIDRDRINYHIDNCD